MEQLMTSDGLGPSCWLIPRLPAEGSVLPVTSRVSHHLPKANAVVCAQCPAVSPCSALLFPAVALPPASAGGVSPGSLTVGSAMGSVPSRVTLIHRNLPSLWVEHTGLLAGSAQGELRLFSGGTLVAGG